MLTGKDFPQPRVKTIYKRYGSRLRAEFRELMAAIREGVIERDIFGLRADALTRPPPSFEFATDDEKVSGFMAWLREQMRNGVLEVIHRNGNTYIKSAYSSGIRYGNARLRQVGFDSELVNASVEIVLDMPVHRKILQLLYTRNYEALKGITTEVEKQIARTLTSGFAQGWGPKKMARKLNDRIDAIGLTRATTLARTETLHAHNTAAKQRYLDMGVRKVGIVNHDPCKEICRPIVEGGPYPIDDIPDGGPPFHPRCMGSLYPIPQTGK